LLDLAKKPHRPACWPNISCWIYKQGGGKGEPTVCYLQIYGGRVLISLMFGNHCRPRATFSISLFVSRLLCVMLYVCCDFNWTSPGAGKRENRISFFNLKLERVFRLQAMGPVWGRLVYLWGAFFCCVAILAFARGAQRGRGRFSASPQGKPLKKSFWAIGAGWTWSPGGSFFFGEIVTGGLYSFVFDPISAYQGRSFGKPTRLQV